jgi:hypothetical protein
MDLYYIINEHDRTISEACDGRNRRFTLHRTMSTRIMNLWLEVVMCRLLLGIQLVDVTSVLQPN